MPAWVGMFRDHLPQQLRVTASYTHFHLKSGFSAFCTNWTVNTLLSPKRTCAGATGH